MHLLYGHLAKIVDRILCHLAAAGIDFLHEIAAFVEQADAHQWQGHVRGGFKVVARKHAKAAGINGHGFVKPVFSGKIDNGVFGRHVHAE